MASECPVCRDPVPWTRTCFTAAWGSWRCEGCGSLLGVRVGRRILAVVVWLVVYFAATRVVAIPFAWDLPATLATFFVIFGGYLLFLDRPRVIEPCGFRCRDCGYDLQGQIDPRCPECGMEFGEAQMARFRRVSGEVDSRRTARSLTRAWVVGLAIVLALTIALVVGTLAFKAQSVRPGGNPEVRQILQALLAFAADNEGRTPRHAIELTGEGALPSTVFATFDSFTALRLVPVADVTLEQFEDLTVERKREVLQAAGDALTDGTIAHRLGDFVFMYHGLQLANTDPDLWVFIWLPDPGQNPPPQRGEALSVGLAGGDVRRQPIDDFVSGLSSQNDLRRRMGLPKLGNLLAVTHDRAMVRQP